LRKPTWNESAGEARWRPFGYDDLMKRDKANLDIFWLKERNDEDPNNLLSAGVLAQEIADDLQTALERFATIAEKMK
jgi:type I restriction enzyme M protein